MKLVFYTNYLNHHQVLVADELYRLLGDEFHFVTTLPCDEKEMKGGADYSLRPYCILAGESCESYQSALRLARDADVCVFGACSQTYAVERAKYNPHGLSFEMAERRLKHRWMTIGSPVFRQWLWNYYRYFRKANFHELCCSSFASTDDMKLCAYNGRHYKWGYFTIVPENYMRSDGHTGKTIRLMWCARFIYWKHPELAIHLAVRLKELGYEFHVDMYGDGVLRPVIEQLSKELNVADYITFYGNVANSQIHTAMRNHDIFLFTSDRLEGWGAVANEAMSNGCVLVASDAIGSTHYLVTHKETGMIFRSGDLDSLYEQVKYLLDNPEERKRISMCGWESMIKLWSPANAAKNLLQLIEDIQAGREASIAEGPCSIAL